MSLPQIELTIERREASEAARRRASIGVWVLLRLALGLLVLLAISVIVFVATQALPSDPARAILGREAGEEQIAALNAQLGLDRPLPAQYLSWLGGVVSADLGASLASGASVSSMVGPRAANSVTLVALVMVIAVPLSLAVGVLTAVRRDRRLDKAVLLGSLALTALPEFVLGLGLVFLFATGLLTVLPAVALIPPGESAIAYPQELILPVATLVLAAIPYLYRLVRAATIEALESDFVTMARLKGLPERQVIRRHALPSALIPMVQGIAITLIWLLGGIVVIEFVFRFPGLGTLLTDAVANRDLPVIQGIVLLFAASAVVFNLVADVLTIYLSPGLRTSGGRR